MIKQEIYSVRFDGVNLIKTYSDENFMIMQDETGILYTEAIDPEDMHRTYTETDIPIEEPEESELEESEIE